MRDIGLVISLGTTWLSRPATQFTMLQWVEALVGDHLGNSEKVVVTREAHFRKWDVVSERMVKQQKVVAYESLRNSLTIHKTKKEINV